ncbi:CHAT domain-containing protein [Phenylobacterium sp.]|jgi:CHAT domain-containing protein|uniref:CHAT domain-containing protein n=1 Tax=Phenylobacterium sp. TaxID=1871053 RepID=UPI0037C8325C
MSDSLRIGFWSAAILAATPLGATAATPEVFPLGQSGGSGAICEAVRDYQDPLGQGGAKAWRVRCRGYSTTALGRIYQLPATQRAAWQAALATRADCQAPEAAPGGIPGELASCRLKTGSTPYVAFSRTRGGALVVAEGLAPLSDVIETGWKVALGEVPPPKSTEVRASAAQAEIAADFPNMEGLAAAETAAAIDPDRLRARGYVQNNEWRFDDAETVFRGLVTQGEATGAAPAQQAEALLNLALNISNSGRFGEAEAYLAEAEGMIPAGDVVLGAQAANYRALHERNRRNFEAAIVSARRALTLRAEAPAARAAATSTAPGGSGVVIDPGTARRLNTPNAAQTQVDPPRVSAAEQLAVQDAQAWHVIGSSQAALGRSADARASLERARQILARSAALGRLSAWLSSRVEADTAQLDIAAGRPADAVSRYGAAVRALRTRHAGSAAEAALLMDLGAAQTAAGQEAAALDTYARAMSIFRAERGGLGDSADAAAGYLDLLLRVAARDPGRAAEMGDRYLGATQTVVSSATAETVNRLAARVAAGDDQIAGLSRAFEDAKRRLRVTESQIAALQADGLYEGEVQAQMALLLEAEQAEADALEARMLAANPRYNQLVAPGATAADLRKALKPGEVYVKLLPLAGRTYGVLLSSDKLIPFAADIGRGDLRATVAQLRRPLEPTEALIPFDATASAALFDKLFGPVKAEVMAATHLIYEAEGPLASLPVSLLVTDAASIRRDATGETDYVRTAWLGAKVASSQVVSGASFLQSRAFAPSAAKQPYLGFGDPALPRDANRAFTSVTRSLLRRSAQVDRVCGETRDALMRIEALPETAAEVREIGASLGTPGSVVVGEAFNDVAVRERADLNDYQVLYFATHGLLPQPDACLPEPALVTSLGGDDSDALLDTSEILNLKIDADLVVLAACDTGGGGADVTRTGLRGGGEALGGLARAMVYAGSRALVVSHWSVDSEASVRLMTGVFASGAPTMAEALKVSQAALIADPKQAHPYFWAPFTLVGDGGRPLPAMSRRVASAAAR